MINNNPPEQQNNRNSSSRSKQIIFIVIIYLMLVMSSKFGNKSDSSSQEKLVHLLNTSQKPSLNLLFGIFQTSSKYIGHWQKIHPSGGQNSSQLGDSFNFQNSGKSKIQFISYSEGHVTFDILIQNGQYIDEGYLYSTFSLKNEQNTTLLNIFRQEKSAIVKLEKQQNVTLPVSTFKIEQIFNTKQIGVTTIEKIVFNFTLTSQNRLQFQSQIHTAKFSVKFNVVKKQSLMMQTVFFAFIVFIMAFFSFNSVLKILKSIIQGSESAQKYSLLTVLMATLWDSVICLICFIQAFTNQENLILFILPSFMLCILFTNLQLRWMLSIFQSSNNTMDLRSIICRFNIISYGSFLLLYPIFLFTNLNIWFFIGISLIILPQIYVNAQKGIRPDLNHPYYSKFLMFRFIIIFYIRGFPFNLFQLKPNYLLCLVCLVLIAGQYSVLWIQKVYGPKKVLPKFLLPPIFNYKLQQQINIQQGSQIPQCAICLAPLHQQAQPLQIVMKNQYQKIKLMKTPCGHKYHSKCLIQWMNIKKQCPQCRAVLPPFQ